jgi:CRP/FNR family transcriptional regulator, cyclic AMP receptor protein
METLERFLKELEMDKNFSSKDIEFMVGCASNAVYKKNDYFFHYGDNADKFFIIRTGKVGIQLPLPGHGSITVQTLGRGAILGWCWIFPPYSRTFTAKAMEDTRTIVFDGACLRKKCEEHPRLGYDFMKYFSPIVMQRLDSTRMQLLDVIDKTEYAKAMA